MWGWPSNSSLTYSGPWHFDFIDNVNSRQLQTLECIHVSLDDWGRLNRQTSLFYLVSALTMMAHKSDDYSREILLLIAL